jgi:Tfp pilus assembly protein PilO
MNKPESFEMMKKELTDGWMQMPSERRIIIVVGIIAIVILGIYTVFNSINKNIEKQMTETENYRKALDYIADNQYTYQLNRAQKEAMRQRLLNADAKVASKLNSIGSSFGFDISVSPSDPHKTSDDSGAEEQEITVTLKNAEYSKVLEYLGEIYKLDTPIYMRHLKLDRTSALTSSDTKLTVTITLLSYRLKEQNAT